jgi:transposase InsO family protein
MEAIIIKQVLALRRQMPKLGGRKLYNEIKPVLEEMRFKFGRDRLFDLLRRENLLVRRKKKYVKTTNSRHRFRKYRNLVKDLSINRPNQVYVADITYIRTLSGFCYLSLLTDACSRKIVGYHLSRSLSIEGCLKALKKALSALPKGVNVIHHSDRGIQYCCDEYTTLLNKHGVKISMTEDNHIYENAMAERVNGILKDEFMLGETLKSYEVACHMVKEAVNIYNTKRPHQSLGYEKPSVRHAA